MNKIKFSIIIPCYNEGENIPLLLQRLDKAIKSNDIEVILINNASTDNSRLVLKTLIPKHKFARTINTEQKGYGVAILSGLKIARGEFIGWTHADLQTDPKDLVKAIKIIAEKNFSKSIYIKGNRKGRLLFDQLFTTVMGIFESLYFGTFFYDINAQPNIFHISFFRKWKNPPNDFSIDLYAYYMAKREKLEIVRFPVRFPNRMHGESSWNTGILSKWKFIKRTLDFSLKLKRTL